jgi:NADH:ubiquinone oxidoreductase subunit 6 (subunit J)
MAKKQPGRRQQGKLRYRFLKALGAITILVTCGVMFVGGADSGVRTAKTIYKCLAATAVIGIIFRVVIKAVQGYEETHGG